MKYLSLFSGIGAFEKALDRMGIPFDLIGFSEIDKYAVESYCAIHNVDKSKNFGDITKIDENALPKIIDLITYGFPCQDISIAGNQKGLFNEDGTQTRSGLFFDALRIIKATQPRVAIAENVKNLTSKKFEEQFRIVLDSLEEAGYNNYWAVLNLKDFGIPQNRERVFIVSIRKDIDNGTFKFPEGFPLELRLKDMLDDVVDEKYYLDATQIKNAHIKNLDAVMYDKSMIGFEGHAREYNDVAPTITSRDYKEPRLINESGVKQIANLMPGRNRANPNQGRLYDSDGLSPTLGAMQGGNRQPFIMEKPTIQRVDIPQTVKIRKYEVDTDRLCETLRHHKALQYLTNNDISSCLGVPVTKVEHWFRRDECFAIPDAEVWMDLKKLLEIKTDEFDASIMTFEEKEGVFEKSERHYFSDGISPTLTSATAAEKIIEPSLRIRKLIPKECFRLMGFDDEDFEKAEAVNSNTQLYKQAGNSIGVPVCEYIIKALLECGALENIQNKGEEKEMELKLKQITFPEVIEFNFDELKAEIKERTEKYVGLVYTDDQIKDAKKDVATLRKFTKALSDERIKVKKDILKPYDEFEGKVKELTAIVDDAINGIDKQVKEYEDKKREEKMDDILLVWNKKEVPEWLHISKVFDEKWLNASVTLKKVEEEIDARLEQIEKDLATLANLSEFSFEATEVYKDAIDINKAIQEGIRLSDIQKRKAEQEARMVNTGICNPDEAKESIRATETEFAVQKQEVCFRCWLSAEDAAALREFFKSRNIKYGAI